SRRTQPTEPEPDETANVLLSATRESPPAVRAKKHNDYDFGKFLDVDNAHYTAEDTQGEGDEFESKGASAPKQKRARTSQAKKSAPRKKQVRGKQGRLEGLMKMPTDIFTEIALNLMPKDIISLARANKFLRKLLMSKSAIHIWHGAMRNVPGIPPCPPDIVVVKRLVAKWMKYFESGCAPLAAPKEIVPSRRRWGYEPHASMSEVTEVQARFDEFKKSGDSAALDKWKENRKKQLKTRRTEAQALSVFLDALQEDRGSELADLKKQHRLAVHNRLLDNGWEQEDLTIHYTWRWEWHVLVDQPKVLTDRTWANLQPKLIPLLEANRESRLAREKSERKRARRNRLEEYLRGIKEERAPIVDVTISPPATPGSSSDGVLAPIQIKHEGIFPNVGDALQWDEMKGFLEDDLTVEAMEEHLASHLSEITQRADKWIGDIEDHLVGLLRKGREEDGLGPDIPNATWPLSNDSSDPLENTTPSQKVMLRADSLFERAGSCAPFVYDALVTAGRSTYSYLFTSLPSIPETPLDIGKFKRHAEAQKAARMLLENLGKPNATFLEMKAAGQRYRCGRCHDRGGYTWEEIVNHFVLEQQTWDRVQKQRSDLDKRGITFRNVHDSAFVTDEPMINSMTKDETFEMHNVENDKVCKVCSKIGGLPEVRAKEDRIIAHLVDVHAISEPESLEHYGPAYHFDEYDDYPVDDYEDPIFWAQNQHWSGGEAEI
ncbi:hypothetical protein FRC07_005144, partial [Ceratobasidium sp. 392]